jgi:predicted metalloprotease with PDZ domain
MADDPMWRGGLAGPDSIYLHADRPLIDQDGTSPLIHELVHVITHARAAPGFDWIVEGLAEFYSLEILRRSGAVSEETHEESMRQMKRRGDSVRSFSGDSTGAETARAVVLLEEIDERIREETEGASSLDQVLAALVAERTVLDRTTLLDLIQKTSGVDVTAVLDRAPKSVRATP